MLLGRGQGLPHSKGDDGKVRGSEALAKVGSGNAIFYYKEEDRQRKDCFGVMIDFITIKTHCLLLPEEGYLDAHRRA